jgi:hypothetical protein
MIFVVHTRYRYVLVQLSRDIHSPGRKAISERDLIVHSLLDSEKNAGQKRVMDKNSHGDPLDYCPSCM